MRPRAIEADAYGSAGREREEAAAQLALQIDDEIVTARAQVREEPRQAGEPRTLPAPRPGPALPGKGDPAAHGGMAGDELGECRAEQPVDLGRRIAAPQLVHHRNSVHDIAQRRELDQQDPAEIGGAQRGGAQVRHRLMLRNGRTSRARPRRKWRVRPRGRSVG